jgi:hypothetical protein
MKNITQLAHETIKKDPKIKAFLFECTQLPPCSNQVRQETGLPVYDALTTVETFCISKKSNQRIEQSEDELSDDEQFFPVSLNFLQSKLV